MAKPSNEVIVRTVALAVTWINLGLTQAGWEVLPWTDEQVGDGVSAALAFAATTWAWWKNNSFTEEAQIADAELAEMKAER